MKRKKKMNTQQTNHNVTPNPIKQMILASMFIAIGMLLPFLILGSPQLGTVFLPMHIPVLLAGLILGPKYGILVGVITPLFRSVLFQMPPMVPTALMMAIELPIYALVIGMAKRLLPSTYIYIYVSLGIALLIGRIAYGVAGFLIYPILGLSFSLNTFLVGAFITGLPGVAIQIVLIPPLFHYLKHARILDDIL